MSNPIQATPFLRRMLGADAIVSAAVGALMALGANALHELLGLPAALLLAAGLALFPYAAYLVCVPRAAVWLPIALNLIWALDCAWVLFGSGFAPTALGQAFVVVQIVTVLAFAELELVGLKRACAIVPA